ncbi:MAG: hypothetical protein GF418_07580 [Chitinivibrionales bacterium]|nr:hypothetical protein [Chitinivibrionales bacterium]MBD3395473.1 hypothetical protein [Chitinivibrionales bacterium]
MISSKTVTAVFLASVLCMAQAMNISGVVKDSGGAGISGATVTLVVAGISTTSGADGSFTLTDNSSQIRQNVQSAAMTAGSVRLQSGKITLHVFENTSVEISIHTIGGRRIFHTKQAYGSGTHAMKLPLPSAGIFFARVSVGKEHHIIKLAPYSAVSIERKRVSNGSSALAKQMKVSSEISDEMLVVKEGQIDYRDSIKTSDTSGIVVKMVPNAGNVTDADGNEYQTVRIGNQVWTVENLRATKYNDGSAIPLVTDATAWSNLTTPGYCFYDNSSTPAIQEKWGALYNWYVLNTGKLTRATGGWRIPTYDDWTQLEEYLIANGYNWDGSTSANKIGKSLAAKTAWDLASQAGDVGNGPSGNNSSGFSALPAGSRDHYGSFVNQSSYAYWWSATTNPEYGGALAFLFYLYYDYETLNSYNYLKQFGFSVRLVRDP